MDGNDNEVPLGKWGEICIKGPGVMRGLEQPPRPSMRCVTVADSGTSE
jgi:hypothetical protein